MITVGTVVSGYEIAKNLNGTKNVLLLKCAISSPTDIQYVQYMSNTGDDSIPPKDSQILIISVGESWKIGVASTDVLDFPSTLLEGEREVYSYDPSVTPPVRKASVAWRSSGVLELNGAVDYAVAFNELKAAFDQLVSDINSATYGSNPIDVPITGSVDSAKVDTVRLP